MRIHANKGRASRTKATGDRLSLQRPGSEAALEFVDNRPDALQLKRLQRMADTSPQADETARFQAMINNSSSVAAQRQRLDRMFGRTVQRQEAPEEEELQMKAEPVPAQREGLEDEEPMQPKPEQAQRLTAQISREWGAAVQKKLTVGAAGDGYEREADQTAKHVMETISGPGQDASQRQGYEEDLQMKRSAQRQGAEEEDLQMTPAAQRPIGREGGDVDPSVERSIRSPGGGGALPDAVRGPMEGAFNADFGGVRVHTGGQADSLNRSMGALAFTTGSDIFFRKGEYSPGTASGKETIAHELTHVVQQSGVRARRRSGTGSEISSSTPHLVGRSPSPVVQRMMGYWEWAARTSGEELRGPGLLKVDVALKDYMADETSTPNLVILRDAVYDYRKKSGEYVEGSATANAIERLRGEIQATFVDIAKAAKAKAAVAKAKLESGIITKEVTGAMGDPAKAADILFTNFIKYGRSQNWAYNSSALVGSILAGESVGQCRSFATALVEMFKKSGIDTGAKAKKIPETNFITDKIGGNFIDPSATGNLKPTGGKYADVGRFFFLDHVVIVTAFGIYDPTSGTKGKTPIWQTGFKKQDDKSVDVGSVWTNGKYQITFVEPTKHGGGYELSQPKDLTE